MRFLLHALVGCISLAAVACSSDDKDKTPEPEDHGPHDHVEAGVPGPSPNFFVSSDTSATGDLGGLDGADARCQALADAANHDGTWQAYLSTEPLDGEEGVDARDRIGSGPFYNVKGVKLADDVDALHDITGDAELFIDEKGEKIPGQWEGSPAGVVHDILTGTGADGTVLVGKTCANWTSAAADLVAQVGHSDGLGPGMNAAGQFSSWQSSHENGGCNDTAPRGGAGRIYCFSP
jgi:hypothetical protein